MERTDGRISAKRLLPVVRAAGYTGSARNLRRAVAEAKAKWRVDHHRGRRPGVWAPGDVLVFDWGEIGPLFVFCAVLAWSRFRFVYFADNLGAQSHHGGVGRVHGDDRRRCRRPSLTDRMGCLKGGTVAGLVVPTPDYVRFVTHYGTRPDFCEGADPESKGLVENLVGYVKSDLMIPEELSVADLVSANAKGRAWCAEVNAQRALARSRRSQPSASRSSAPCWATCPSSAPGSARSSLRKVDRLSCVRFGSARYSVPTTHIGRTVELRVARRRGHGRVLGRDHRRARARRPW